MFRAFHKLAVWSLRRMPLIALLAMRAYNRLLKFGGPYRCRTYFGSEMRCDPTDLIQSRILFFGHWEPNISRLIERILTAGDVFVDVGANVGYDTLLGAGLVGDEGGVVAIEASTRTFSALGANLALNQTKNVRGVCKAVSDCRGTAILHSGPYGNIGMATILDSKNRPRGDMREDVRTLPLDEILSPVERARTKLIKMDIEGAELPVIRRFLDTIDLYPADTCLIVEVSPCENGGGWAEQFSRFRDLGFNAYQVENEYGWDWYLRWRPAELQPLEALPARGGDILFARQSPPQMN